MHIRESPTLRGQVATNLDAEVVDGTLAWPALCVTVYRSKPPNNSESVKSPLRCLQRPDRPADLHSR
jgi:hypothetical protein